jgi:hypothetical protein
MGAGKAEERMVEPAAGPWRVPFLPRRGSALRWAFDLFYGVLLPPVLIVLDNEWDPMGMGGINLLPYRPYTPILAFAAILCLLGWWLLRDRVEWAGAFAAGPLLAGAAFALGTGLLLLPISLFAILMLGLGLLGMVPLFTGIVFLDAGLDAFRSVREQFRPAPAAAIAIAGALLLASGCAGAGRLLERMEIQQVAILAGDEAGDAGRAESILRTLRSCPGVALAGLERAARAAEERDPAKAKRLAGSYERITGHPLPVLD